MYCRKCGKEIFNNKEYCEACQTELDNNTLQSQQQHESNSSQRKKCCPKCKSRNLQITTNTEFHSETKGGGYSAGKGCCGYMALGPLGLLCGACGSESKTTVTNTDKHYWVCRDCGNKFRDLEDIEADITISKNSSKTAPVAGTVMGIVLFVFWMVIFNFFATNGGYSLSYLISQSPIVIWIPIIISSISIGGGFLIGNADKVKITEYENEKKNIEENGYIDE